MRGALKPMHLRDSATFKLSYDLVTSVKEQLRKTKIFIENQTQTA